MSGIAWANATFEVFWSSKGGCAGIAFAEDLISPASATAPDIAARISFFAFIQTSFETETTDWPLQALDLHA